MSRRSSHPIRDSDHTDLNRLARMTWNEADVRSPRLEIYVQPKMLRHLVELFVTKRIDTVIMSMKIAVVLEAIGATSPGRGIIANSRQGRAPLLPAHPLRTPVDPCRAGQRARRETAQLIRVRLEFRRREVKRKPRRIAFDLSPSLDREVQDRDRAGRIFGGEAARFRLGARSG